MIQVSIDMGWISTEGKRFTSCQIRTYDEGHNYYCVEHNTGPFRGHDDGCPHAESPVNELDMNSCSPRPKSI